MQHMESTFMATGGIHLFTQWWLPEGELRAALALVHGVGEHCGRYPKLVGPLTETGIGVYAYDQRGFGRSPGQRGHIDTWEQYRGDLRAFLEWVKTAQSGVPVFLYGHSMGALVVLDYLIHARNDLHGAVISGAPIQPVGVAKPLLVLVAKALSKVWPRFPIDVGLETAALSRDPAVVKAYEDDPLVTGRVSARWGTEAMRALDEVRENPAKLSVPLLFVHGEDDRLNSAEGVRRYFEQIPHQDKELKIYPASFHEVHNDLGCVQEEVDIGAWIQRHL